LLGFVIGCGAALGTAAVQEQLDQTLKNEEELARATGIPVLATFSLIKKKNQEQGSEMLFKAFRTLVK
jgi:capsular polysaccharide biosynthesis protein